MLDESKENAKLGMFKLHLLIFVSFECLSYTMFALKYGSLTVVVFTHHLVFELFE